MKNSIHPLTLIVCVFFLAMAPANAQLVADSTTAAIDATSTNVIGPLIIGTNGSFTTLIITNAGFVTNSSTAAIGLNPSAIANRVIVNGPLSAWHIEGNLAIGSFGSFNELVLTNGGYMFGSFANIGHLPGSAFNTATVTGPGSVWNLDFMVIGNAGQSNLLVIADGGMVTNNYSYVGFGFDTVGNVAIIKDAGSKWICAVGLGVGQDASFNQMIITNGGKVLSDGAYVGGNEAQSGSGNSNSVIITGSGSTWTNTSTSSVGNFGSYNQLTISNGGVMRNTASFANLILGWQPSGSNNSMLVTGPNSLFSNRDTSGSLTIGQSSPFNQLSISDGGVAESDTGYIGGNSGSSNNMALVTGPGSLWFSTFVIYVGKAGPGNQLTVQNGGTIASSLFFLGNDDTSFNNTTTITGGNLITTNISDTGLTDIRRGTFTLNSGLVRTDFLLVTNGAQSQFIFNGGTLRARSITNINGSTFAIGDGASSATLELLGTGTNVFANGLLVTSNATLKGTGRIIGNVTNSSGGTLSPGASIGQLIGNGYVTLASDSTNVFELDKTSGTNDNITGLAGVTYGGTLILTNLSGTLVGGSSFKLFTAPTYSGAFTTLIPLIPGPGMDWDTNDLATSGTLRIASPPFIISEPNDTNVVVGQNATFSVTAGGTSLMSYQWRFNATNIDGATSTNYTRANAQTNHAGPYSVVISNYLGSVTSRLAVLTVNIPTSVATNLVISQIYGGGGLGGATYRNDFVELFNPTPNAISVATWSIQQAGASGTSWQLGNLRGSVAPYSYYLVQLASSAAIGSTIPVADATNSINISAANGKLLIATLQVMFSGSRPTANVVDFVGFGSANAFEGSAAALGAANNTTSILRKNGGYTDLNDNTNDFTLATPAPRNSASPANPPPSAPVVPGTIGSIVYATNQFQFTVTGTPGTNYIVQVSTNLTISNWLSLLTNASPFLFVETNSNGFNQRYYRVWAP